MNDFERGYFAGLLDGEGSIHCIPNGTPRLRVAICNNCQEVLDWLDEHIAKGNRYEFTTQSGKIQYKWELCKLDAMKEVLSEVKDSVVIKKKQVEIALAYLDTFVLWQRNPPDTALVVRELLIKRLRECY